MESRISKYILTFLVIICFVIMIISYVRSDVVAPAKNVISTVLTPVQKGLNGFGAGINAGVKELANLKNVSEENESLKKSVEELVEENNKLRAESAELERLRSLYELDNSYMSYEKVAARVIARDSDKWFQMFRIDKGIADGIEPGMNVLSGGGLVGIVTETGNNYSMVRSIIDEESAVYAMSQISADTCLVRGNAQLFEEGLLELANMDKNARINDGDAIVTSNLSTKFLPGLLIGYANGISINSQHLSKSGTLIPVADFDDLREVLIIKQLKADME
ncbi:MAG: rod shape-determining protein MreC [Lachnospiraceae bacterium]|nr:rod shape-determining protein MreC [Candidatus Hippenecus merdae]